MIKCCLIHATHKHLISVTHCRRCGHCVDDNLSKLVRLMTVKSKHVRSGYYEMDLCGMFFQMEVIVGDFGIVVVPRDGVDTERIMNHSSVLRKHKVKAVRSWL